MAINLFLFVALGLIGASLELSPPGPVRPRLCLCPAPGMPGYDTAIPIEGPPPVEVVVLPSIPGDRWTKDFHPPGWGELPGSDPPGWQSSDPKGELPGLQSFDPNGDLPGWQSFDPNGDLPGRQPLDQNGDLPGWQSFDPNGDLPGRQPLNQNGVYQSGWRRQLNSNKDNLSIWQPSNSKEEK